MHLDVDPDLAGLPPDRVEVLSRCVQEVVTDAARHSDAENLWGAVEELAGVATVTARDDGWGSGVVPGHGLKPGRTTEVRPAPVAAERDSTRDHQGYVLDGIGERTSHLTARGLSVAPGPERPQKICV